MRVSIPQSGLYLVSFVPCRKNNTLSVNGAPVIAIHRESSWCHRQQTSLFLNKGDEVEGYGARVYYHRDNMLAQIKRALNV